MSLSSSEKATVKAGCRLEQSWAGTKVKWLVTLDSQALLNSDFGLPLFFLCHGHLSNVGLAFVLHKRTSCCSPTQTLVSNFRWCLVASWQALHSALISVSTKDKITLKEHEYTRLMWMNQFIFLSPIFRMWKRQRNLPLWHLHQEHLTLETSATSWANLWLLHCHTTNENQCLWRWEVAALLNSEMTLVSGSRWVLH